MPVETPREVALKALREHLAAADGDSGRLPPERELASRIKVGRRTVREALTVLELEGAIWRRQGQGTFFGQPKLVGDREVAELAHRVNPLEILEARLFRDDEIPEDLAMGMSDVFAAARKHGAAELE